MKKPEIPFNEKERLAALQSCNVLDTSSEVAFDALTKLASQICGTPIALVSLIDESRQWFKSRVGLDAAETHRDISFCGHAILENNVFIIEDSEIDPRFADNPLVTGEPTVRFYAGVPLFTKQGFGLWTLCVIDHVPGKLSKDQIAQLKNLAVGVIELLELKRKSARSISFQALVNAVEDYAICMLDSMAMLQAGIQELQKLKGYSEKEIIGHSFSQFYSKEDQEAGIPEKALLAAKTYGNINEFGWRIKKDESRFWAEVSISPIHDENKKIIGFSKVTKDLTTSKKAEEEILQAKIEALLAVEVKTEFLATMSHEIRTPINGVIGMTDLLIRTQLSEEQRKFVETISLSGRSLLALVNDILDFSKIDAGKMELEILEFNLDSYVRDLMSSFQSISKNKDIEFQYKPSLFPKMVFGDDGKIGQIICNLVSNALKFTEKGSVTINLKCEENGPDSIVTISVQDTGLGIHPDATSKMFQAFSQAKNSKGKKYGGTGLGLSISKKLVDLMGGEISFESEYGKGSIFYVKLKLTSGRIIKIAKEEGKQGLLQNGAIQFNARVLIAEDNAVNQFVVCSMLENLGCSCQVVGNGIEALDALKNAKFDLVLMDCQMPEMDGYEASQMIRASKTSFSQIVIIALTANAIKGDEKRCREAGMTDYLTKPLELTQLKATLKKYLIHYSILPENGQ